MKLLLVGSLNEALYSLNEYLLEDFEIQMCSENSKNVKDMIRLLRPSIIVFNVLEMNEVIKEIFGTMEVKLNAMPMVVIGTSQMKDDLKRLLTGFKNVRVLSRPINTVEVKKACFELLSIGGSVSSDNDDNVKQIADTEKKKSILVVDDSALILRKIKQLLENNYKILLANSGAKALELLENSAVDLILLDYDMPDMDGREVFERIISNEKTKEIPVVFLTSIAQKDPILEVLKNKPFGYILKPPVQDKLLSVIREALKE